MPTSRRRRWIAYASHEGTVAFGGTLTGALRATWRDVDSFRRYGVWR